jgi:hypothetical protein
MRIESLLSARLFVAPQLCEGYVYFVSDLSGRLSLYRMEARPGGSVPEPLLPPHLALQNPHLDVLKFENKLRCYNAITDFFKEHLKP